MVFKKKLVKEAEPGKELINKRILKNMIMYTDQPSILVYRQCIRALET